eukprot:12895613-Prorocentrum_lima.AAC.1
MPAKRRDGLTELDRLLVGLLPKTYLRAGTRHTVQAVQQSSQQAWRSLWSIKCLHCWREDAGQTNRSRPQGQQA